MSDPRDGCPCPCGRLQGSDARATPGSFAQCCGRWRHTPAPDAESLMRSRYSAFVRVDPKYLLASWHPSTRPPSLDLEAGVRWLGLQVRDHRETGPDRAEVEFVARSKWGGKANRLHETSRFVLEAGQWWYVDGQVR